MKLVSYTFDIDKGLPLSQTQNGLTVIDEIAHVKIWRTGNTLNVCVLPKYGKWQEPGKVVPTTEHHQYVSVVATDTGIEAGATHLSGKCAHGWEPIKEVGDRRPGNWCSVCCDWFRSVRGA